MGGKPSTVDAKGRLIHSHRGGWLMRAPPINGEPATCANGGTIGFSAESGEEAEAWHKADVENGGNSIEDPPGVRQGATGGVYLACLRDPDGNKLCELHRIAA